MSLKIALMGAGGKMGCRLTDNLMRMTDRYDVAYVEISPAGIANLAARGIKPTPQTEALADAQAVILALPDRLIGKITHEIIPLLQPGTLVIGLDPAAAYAGVMPVRKDLTYFVAHPCHPGLFNEETSEAGRKDWFGGVVARHHVVCALYQGKDEDFPLCEQITRDMYAPVINTYRITVEQMAILEPALVETFSSTLIMGLKEAYTEAVSMGVPAEAAWEFLSGHVRIQFAVIFGFAGFDFSDGAKLAIERAGDKIFKPDWKAKIFDLEAIRASVAEITDSLNQ